MDKRRLGASGITVTSVALGCWPISGMTSLDVNSADSLRTLEAALDAGVNFLDTAYCYGADGESEKLVGEAVSSLAKSGKREQVVVASKGGIHWASDLSRVADARPARLIQECDESLQRLGLDHIDLLYLHAPDPNVPIAESAGAYLQLLESGKIRSVGVSNADVEQLGQFRSVCPVHAVQPPYNMLQRGIESDIIPWCQENDAAVVTYWPLMKGLLAGKLRRGHQFDPSDKRLTYPMFSGDEWEKNQNLLDQLEEVANQLDRTIAQLVVNWTFSQPGITSVLCGAKREWQIQETADAMGWEIPDEVKLQLEAILAERGAVNY